LFFQAEYEGSIPFTRSKIYVNYCICYMFCGIYPILLPLLVSWQWAKFPMKPG
jgi:hypothetical protein